MTERRKDFWKLFVLCAFGALMVGSVWMARAAADGLVSMTEFLFGVG